MGVLGFLPNRSTARGELASELVNEILNLRLSKHGVSIRRKPGNSSLVDRLDDSLVEAGGDPLAAAERPEKRPSSHGPSTKACNRLMSPATFSNFQPRSAACCRAWRSKRSSGSIPISMNVIPL